MCKRFRTKIGLLFVSFAKTFYFCSPKPYAIPMKKIVRHAFLLMAFLAVLPVCADNAEVKMKITSRYLNFPVSHQTERRALSLRVKGRKADVPYFRSVVRLTEGEPDYWVFQDVSDLKGKTVILSFDGSDETLQRVYQADTFPGEAMLYRETYRPQYHFTTRRGWMNDPNGLVYDATRDEYHLFYQHNPFEREWENMHWGHAVSHDLIHWSELPDALHPDDLGTIFSGSAWMDGERMIVFHTSDSPEAERQCMAVSTDGGRTFTKHAGNPVIDSHLRWQSHDTRDPKLFRYGGDEGHWVLVLNERDGHTIYTSTNLTDWTPQSHITGFWECPELFPLGDRWVMWGASGTYMVGQFDGYTFTPSGPKQMNLNGSAYAAQCFNQMPDGRVVKMAWGRIGFPDMPFNGCMLLPQEQTLRPTPQGLRLYSYPAAECEHLFTRVLDVHDVSAAEANTLLLPWNGNDCLRIKATLHLTYATGISLRYRGQNLFDYDMNGNRLQGEFYANPLTPDSMDVELDLYIDRTIVEGYVDGGAFSYSFQRDVRSRNGDGYQFHGNELQIRHLEVFEPQSIWQ